MIELDFYTLRPEVVQSIAKHGLSKAESKLFFHLLQLDPFGDRPIKVKVAEILLATGIGKTAYHQAIAKFEQLGWFDFKHTDVYISNLSCVRKSEKAVQKSVKTEKRFGKTDYQSAKTESRDTELAQGAEQIFPHTDLIPIHTDPDRSDNEFFDFENANSDAARSATDESKLSDFEQAIYSCTDEAIENRDLKAVDPIDLTNTPEQPINQGGGDPFRRRVEDFILKSLQLCLSGERRKNYFARFTQADWEKWEARMSPPASPPPPLFVPEVVEVCSPEIALANIAKIKEMLARGAK